jgi:hypothetical protein
MTQVLPRYCPRCGAPIVTNSNNCATCGLPLGDMLSSDQNMLPEQLHHDQESLPEIEQQINQEASDPKREAELDRVPTVQLGRQSNTKSFTTKGEQTYPKSAPQKKRKVGRKELLVLLVLLLFMLGAIVYAFAGFPGLALPGFVNIQPSIKTTTINATVPYAGVNITILNAQQSQKFLNDPNSNSDGMVRLNLQEKNPTDVKVVWSYATIARLVMPNKSLVGPTYVNSIVRVAPGVSQKSIVDYAVPMNVSLSQLTLVLGAPDEAEMLIPLVRNVDVSKYQPQTTKLHSQMLYFGLNWTLTSATSSLSIPDQQAAKGMRFVTLMLKVDNTLSQIAIPGSPYDYMRLQYGNRFASPEHTTFPVAFQIGAVGINGIVSFQVPQQISSFTFVLVPQKDDNGDQSSTEFHLP